MKTLATLSVLGLVFGVSGNRILAAAGMEMPWGAQLGICGASLSIVFVLVTRTIPKMAAKMAEETRLGIREAADTQAQAMDGLKDEIRDGIQGLRADMTNSQNRQIDLLSEVLKQKTGGMGS